MGIKALEKAYLLHHIIEHDNGYEDVKLIGVFSSRKKASDALIKRMFLPEFKDYIDGFSIDKEIINTTDWDEGFVTVD
jgi:hypothetical protein